jgi:hypothetical protein
MINEEREEGMPRKKNGRKGKRGKKGGMTEGWST